MTYVCRYPSPLGLITMTCQGDALTGLWLETQPFDLGDAIENQDTPVFSQVRDWLDAYFRGENPEINFPLSPSGSSFQLNVWEILRRIPYGETTTYGAIAKQISPTMSAQAVGGAVGRNPISIIVPCHRCMGVKGRLTGYTGGLDKKIWLLNHEGVIL